jgi:uncharacterized protein (DUF983 family)
MDAPSSPLRVALACKCPRCGKGDIYKPGFLCVTVRDRCESCGLALGRNDSADGPAVFLIFILGFSLVPTALLFEWALAPPLWVHMVLWTVVALGLTLGLLRPLKAFVIGLQFRHRGHTWGGNP